MILISHRGNLTGPNSCLENSPQAIIKATECGYDCEIDVWKKDDNFYLGHDVPIYKIEKDFLRNKMLWIHCKNFEALTDLISDETIISNVFFHNNDSYTITSKGIIWAYPLMKVDDNCIIVMKHYDDESKSLQVKGICSDYVSFYS